ncbi:MAG: hypothetical protein IJZ96_02655 [Lachnospiraceae bacterium]|nr:hypothetical protein [Lachnospiraceae bacterium]
MDKNKISDIKSSLEEIADVLYKDDVNTGMAMMAPVIPDLIEISAQIENEEFQARLMTDALAPALEAMEEKDSTALADIISYELIAILDEM